MSEQLQTPAIQNQPPVAEGDASALGGNVTQPFDEEVYAQKVEFLEGRLEKWTTEALALEGARLTEAFGGHNEASRQEVWETIKQYKARRAALDVANLLGARTDSWSKPEDKKDIFDKITSKVAWDVRGSLDPDREMTGVDVANFNIGAELDAFVDSAASRDPATVAKATATIRLLVAQGAYKFHRWGRGDQLKTALELGATFTEWVPDFDPHKAGMPEVRDDLINSLAALQVDNQTKPNYRHAKPERNHLFSDLSNCLTILNRAEAHLFLRDNDISLPPVGQQPPVPQQ